ncbi:neurogenic locus notch homolog 1-like isoform X3, partial [Paramuricea clavata]
VNECASRPCRNNGECRELITGPGYDCLCPSGFTGKNCEKMINLCETNPCCAGAVCSYGLNSFSCQCNNGRKGPSCCSSNTWCSYDMFNVSTCHDHGNCSSLQNQFNCSCERGWRGSRCEIDINECDSQPCVHGECRNTRGSYECICEDDYNDTNCDQKIDDCEGVFCENDGQCVDGVHNYTCECAQGLMGRHCEIDIDECSGKTECSRTRGVCINTHGGYHCGCRTGYEDPPSCEERTNYCKSFPCGNNGICQHEYRYDHETVVVSNYSCACFVGWEGRNCRHREIEIETPGPAELHSSKEKASRLPLTIGISFAALVLCAVVMVIVLYKKRQRHFQRMQETEDLGAVKFNNRASEILDPVPDQLMFSNPLYNINRGFDEESDLNIAVSRCNWEVSDC